MGYTCRADRRRNTRIPSPGGEVLSEHELAGLISYLASDPKAGDALLVYGKNERADLTANQRKAVADFAAAIKATRKRK